MKRLPIITGAIGGALEGDEDITTLELSPGFVNGQ